MVSLTGTMYGLSGVSEPNMLLQNIKYHPLFFVPYQIAGPCGDIWTPSNGEVVPNDLFSITYGMTYTIVAASGYYLDGFIEEYNVTCDDSRADWNGAPDRLSRGTHYLMGTTK